MLGALKTERGLKHEQGFTLIELMIVVAIIGILASVGMGAYQTYIIRAQVAEGITMAANAKAPITDAYLNNGEAPANREEAGMSDDADRHAGQLRRISGRLQRAAGNHLRQRCQPGDRERDAVS